MWLTRVQPTNATLIIDDPDNDDNDDEDHEDDDNNDNGDNDDDGDDDIVISCNHGPHDGDDGDVDNDNDHGTDGHSLRCSWSCTKPRLAARWLG
jgi:hypothetical protein